MNTKKSGHLKRVIAAGLSVMMFSGYVPTDVIPDSFALVVAAATTVPMKYDFDASTHKLVLKGGEYSGTISWGTLDKRQVYTIEIEADREVKLDNCIDLFKNFPNVQTIDLTGLDTTAVKTMGNMFSGCGSLTSVTFGEKFDTSNVANMSDMFDGCASLESVDISKFVTNNVTELDLSKMFNDCGSLTELDIGDMDTSKAIVAGMLTNCSGLEKIIVGADANIENPITFPVVTDTDTY
ncbi:MAG: BspA family leucine-rich repeat surface protein, partial [Clostridia bacterium]|nr:BspA family leucine-rich repeat surface protein [Clostridia bacterium]